MEASKCPKCGDEPFFIEHIEKWYCYGCNSYIESDEDHHVHCEGKVHVDSPDSIVSELHALELESKPVCKNCGAIIESIRDGRLYCSICEASPIEDPCNGNSGMDHNDAQSLIDSAVCGPIVDESATKAEKPAPKAASAKPVPAPVPVVVKPVEVKAPEKAPEKASDIKMCATCGQPLKFIEKYTRYYCYACRKYAPKDEPVKPKVVPSKPEPVQKSCPGCSGELKYIEKYNEYYCYTCKKYPLRAHKSVQDKPTPAKKGPLECPKCGGPVKLIEKYSRYYCYSCKEYAPKDLGGLNGESQETKHCPACKEQMKFISEYNEWYCYKCRKYALRPSKPVLLV